MTRSIIARVNLSQSGGGSRCENGRKDCYQTSPTMLTLSLYVEG